jgi:predicted lipoprotein with Yx(FWY)xxD motif
MTLKPAISVLAFSLLVACGQDVTPPDRGATGGEAARAPVQAESPAVDPARVDVPAGTQPSLIREGSDPGHVADASGAALYYVEGNTDGSQCDTACQQVWPPVVLSGGSEPVAGPGVQQPAVGTMRTLAGEHQLTYHGQLLYRYAGDRGARTTTGHDVRDEWGHWRLMGVDGKSATPSPASPDANDQQQPGAQPQDGAGQD